MVITMEKIKVIVLTGVSLPPEKINGIDKEQALCETEKISNPSTSVRRGMKRSKPNENFLLSLLKLLRIKKDTNPASEAIAL